MRANPEQAYLGRIDQARKLGANAIIAMRYDSDGIAGDQYRANEVFCYGTAVVVGGIRYFLMTMARLKLTLS